MANDAAAHSRSVVPARHGDNHRGTPDALLRLADALKAVTQAIDGRGVEVEMIDASGEHYDVRIEIAAEVDGMGDTPGALAMMNAQRDERS